MAPPPAGSGRKPPMKFPGKAPRTVPAANARAMLAAMQISRRTLLGALASLPMTRLAHGQVVHRLTTLHMNDLHSRHEPVDGRALACRAEGGRADCYGGTA